MKTEEFSDKDFEGMLFQVNRIPDNKNLFKYIPVLASYPEFKVELVEDLKPIAKLFKYIAMVYDINSPFFKHEVNIAKRKIAVAKYVGYDISTDGKFDPYIEEVMRCKVPAVTPMIIRYVRMHNNHKYSLLVAIEEQYYNFLTKLASGEAKTSEIETIMKMEKQIQEIKTELLAGDQSPELAEDLFLAIEAEKLELSPEFIARKKRAGEVPIEVPEPFRYE
jgi:hypothetical protein